jgi:adenylate cyclase
MESNRVRRRLTAIVAADVAGYSRLMGLDEAGTLARLKAARRDVLDPKIAEYGGRVVKSTGDGLLAEFGSIVDATRCFHDVQCALAKREAAAPADQRLQFRVGIHLGDVIDDEKGDIFGEGVNLASRLQELAEPGGVCVSGTAYESIVGKVGHRFKYGGVKELRHITRPVQIWHRDFTESESPELAEHPVLSRADPPLSEKASIAVLPFPNMSGDPEQEYFADGITEDIITELSRFRSVLVIARNTTFGYKGQVGLDVKRVGRELKVRYVLEGSVRKAGNRVRITAQLIDTETGAHVWAQRYDRELTDIFAVQDEVTIAIVTALAGQVEAAELERARHKPPASLDAYDLLQRAKEFYHRPTREDHAHALALLEQAIARDPAYAQAHAWLSCTIGRGLVRGYLPWSSEMLRRAAEAGERARAIDDNDSDSHRVLADIRLIERNYEVAEYHHERAIGLNPNDPRIVAQRGELLMWLGRPDEGVPWLERAIRLDPSGAERRLFMLACALFAARRYGEAIPAFLRCTADPHLRQAYLAACYAQIGDAEAAQAAAREALRLEPGFSARRYLSRSLFKKPQDRQHVLEAFLAAGL